MQIFQSYRMKETMNGKFFYRKKTNKRVLIKNSKVLQIQRMQINCELCVFIRQLVLENVGIQINLSKMMFYLML